MANNIVLTSKFIAALDEVYKVSSKSAVLEAPSALVQTTADANEFKVAKIALQGLADYKRNTGYTDGDITLQWETHKFTHDRNRAFNVDAMDDLESLSLVTANVMAQFLRTRVVPEVDAIRFAQYATKAGTSVEADLAAGDVIGALTTAMSTMQEKEVETEGCYCFITPTIKNILESEVKRSVGNGSISYDNGITRYNGMPLISVPQARFYSAVKLHDGVSDEQKDGGFEKGADAKDLNFLIVDPQAVLQITKHAKLREFSPDVNQSADAWRFVYRLYHDAFVLDNKVDGIYCHHKAA